MMNGIQEPLVSIIITFYNEEIVLDRCLKSVQNQTYKNIEVILINDGSNDNSLQIAESFFPYFTICKIISIENVGHSEARNQGLKNSKGDYVTFLDADDEFEFDMIASCMQTVFQENTDLIVCKFTVFDKEARPVIISGWKESVGKIKSTNELVYEMFTHGISENVWAKMFKSTIAKQIFFLKDLWFDDRPFVMEYLFKANTVSFLDKSLLRIHKRNSSITRRTLEAKRIIDETRAFKQELKLFKKYSTITKLKEKIMMNHAAILMDTFIIQIIEKDTIVNLPLVRKTYLNCVKEFKIMIQKEQLNLNFKKQLKLKLLSFPVFFGWNFSNIIVEKLTKRRMETIRLLKKA